MNLKNSKTAMTVWEIGLMTWECHSSDENPQGQMGSSSVGFFKKEFQALNTSISLCVTEKGFICTLTLSIEDKTVFDAIVQNDLRDKMVSLEFEDGSNPYTAK